MHAPVLGLDDWQRLLRDCVFFDEAFQTREGTLCFVFSRLRAIDEESERGKKRIAHLSFEDFLEAIVRVSTMKVCVLYTLFRGWVGRTAVSQRLCDVCVICPH